MNIEKVESVVIEGRSWFDKVNGNSYYSAQIWVNGRVVGRLPFTYGYGDMYRFDSLAALKMTGWLIMVNGWYFNRDGSPVIVYSSNSWVLKREMFGALDFETPPTISAVA